MRFFKKVTLLASVGLVTFGLYSYHNRNTANSNLNNSTTTANANVNQLSRLNYRSGTKAWTYVNHNHSNLNPHSWKYDHVTYSRLDRENRTSRGNTGWLDKKNVANDSLRTRQVVAPTGYHQKRINGNYIVNRGHEIAYSLSKGIDKQGKYNPRLESGDQNNMKNLFTQTAFSNQEVQTVFESKVRNALRNNEKVIFQVKPIFQGKDLMAKGVQMQAISTNRKLNFNVYLFNVQPNIRFNYKNGTSKIDRNMKVQTPKNAPHFNNKRSWNNNRKYNYRNSYRGYRKHHYVRNYLLYRSAKHMMYRHYAKRNYRHYAPRHRNYYHYHRYSIF